MRTACSTTKHFHFCPPLWKYNSALQLGYFLFFLLNYLKISHCHINKHKMPFHCYWLSFYTPKKKKRETILTMNINPSFMSNLVFLGKFVAFHFMEHPVRPRPEILYVCTCGHFSSSPRMTTVCMKRTPRQTSSGSILISGRCCCEGICASKCACVCVLSETAPPRQCNRIKVIVPKICSSSDSAVLRSACGTLRECHDNPSKVWHFMAWKLSGLDSYAMCSPSWFSVCQRCCGRTLVK